MSNQIKIRKSHIQLFVFVVLILFVGVLVYSNWDKIKPDKTVAEVNGEKIKSEEIKKVQEAFNKQTGTEINESLAIEQLVSRKLLLQEAEKKGIHSSKEDVEIFLSEKLIEIGSNLDEFKVQVKNSGGDYSELVEAYQEQLILQKLVNQLSEEKEIFVSEQEARQFYDKNGEIFEQGGEDTEFEIVKEQIMEVLLQQKQGEMISNQVEELRLNSTIVYY